MGQGWTSPSLSQALHLVQSQQSSFLPSTEELQPQIWISRGLRHKREKCRKDIAHKVSIHLKTYHIYLLKSGYQAFNGIRIKKYKNKTLV